MINIDELKKKKLFTDLIIEELKKWIIFWVQFTKKYINNLNENDLLDLEKLLNIDDTNLYNFYNGFKTDFEFENNNINFLYKNFNYTKNDGGETGIRTQERVAPFRFSRPVLSTAQPSLREFV